MISLRATCFTLTLALSLGACEKKQEPAKPKTETPVAAAPAAAPSAAPDTVVKIGSVAPLTGPQAHLGKDNDNGAKLAIEEINATNPTIGGKKIKFELVSEDDQADPKTGTIVAQKLIDSKVTGVIGHL